MAETAVIVATTILSVSLSFLVHLQIKVIKNLRQKLLEKDAEVKPTLTQDAAELLHSLTTTGKALVVVTPVDASEFFLRRPT